MSYLEMIRTYIEQGEYESAMMICNTAYHVTGNRKYMFARNQLETSIKYGEDMKSSADLAAQDALALAIQADEEQRKH